MKAGERKYKVLDKQIQTSGEYALVPIRFEDRLAIMKWRNEQMYHLRQAKLLTEKDQTNYFTTVIDCLFEQDKPNQILFSFLKNGKCIGYGGLVHINWIDLNAEISFIMDTELESKDFESNWCCYLGLIEKVAFTELNLHKIYTYAFDLRPKLYKALAISGFTEAARLKEHCYFNGQFIDVLIHDKLNKEGNLLRKVEEGDLMQIFDWSNDPLVRDQSYNSAEITIEGHTTWFNQKLNSADDLMLMGEQNGKPFGLIRFSREKDHTVVGVLIGADFRGKGLAAQLLLKGCAECFEQWGESIHAYIKASNKASVRTFEKAGFTLNKETLIDGVESYIYILTK